MAFWGTEVKPGRPFTHLPHTDDARPTRLHISQATLGIGSATQKSVVQCNIGKRSPVFLCSLFPERAESCQLNLEFQEDDEVVFSVLGPRSVHLTGYYLSQAAAHYKLDDESESYGEDIADTETERSDDEDEYGGSFIDDDDDPEVFSHSPASSGGVDEETLHEKNPKNEKPSYRRLRKKFQLSQSDDDCTSKPHTFANGGTGTFVLGSESEDKLPISEALRQKAKKATDHAVKEVKDDSNCVLVAEQQADDVIDSQLKRLPDQHVSILPSEKVFSENGIKAKKISRKQSDEEKRVKGGVEVDFFSGTFLKWDKTKQSETKTGEWSQDMTAIIEDDKWTVNTKGELLFSPPSVQEIGAKSRKKYKKQAKGEISLEAESPFQGNLNREDKAQLHEAKDESIGKDILLNYEGNREKESDEKVVLPWNSQQHSTQLGPENGLKPKRKRKRGAKDKTPEADNDYPGNTINEDKASHDELKLDGVIGNGSVQHVLLRNEQNQKKGHDEMTVLPRNSHLPSTQLGPENGSKTKRKRKKLAEDKTLVADSANQNNIIKEHKASQDELKADGIKHETLKDEQNQRVFDNMGDQSVCEERSGKKKKKKKTHEKGVALKALNMEGSKDKPVMDDDDNNTSGQS